MPLVLIGTLSITLCGEALLINNLREDSEEQLDKVKGRIALVDSMNKQLGESLQITHTKMLGLEKKAKKSNKQIQLLKDKNKVLVRENKKLKKQLSLQAVKARTTSKHVVKVPAGWKTANGQATAYSPLDNRSGIESMGDPTKTSIGLTVGYGKFAVDPKRIPYGSKIILTYGDGSTEEGIAADTGGAMRNAPGIVIDVFRQSYEQTIAFGRKNVQIAWQAPQK